MKIAGTPVIVTGIRQHKIDDNKYYTEITILCSLDGYLKMMQTGAMLKVTESKYHQLEGQVLYIIESTAISALRAECVLRCEKLIELVR